MSSQSGGNGPVAETREPGNGGPIRNSTLWVDRTMARSERVEIEPGSALVQTVRCPGREGANEDAAAVVTVGERAAVLAVADGMGGAPAGATASALALRSLIESLDGTDGGNPNLLRAAVLDGFERANASVLALGVGAATTLSVVEIRGRTMRPYHVGDSQILVIGKRGRLKYESLPHSPVGYGVEAGLIDSDEAMHHEERHVVSNMVGTAEMRIEVGAPLELAPLDTVALVSDGVADNLHVDEIVESVRKGPLRRGMKSLVERTLARMTGGADGRPSKPDDLACILFRPRRR
jgi:serine/threonine protein phosphatase PrpC